LCPPPPPKSHSLGRPQPPPVGYICAIDTYGDGGEGDPPDVMFTSSNSPHQLQFDIPHQQFLAVSFTEFLPLP